MVQQNPHMNPGGMQKEIDIRTILRDVLKKWWVILSLAITITLASNVTLIKSFRPVYTTSATYVVTSRGLNNSVYTNLRTAQQMTERLQQIITSPVLKNKVAEDLGIPSVPGNISCTMIKETNLLVLQVKAYSPQMAYRILKSVMKNYPTLSEYLIDNAVMQVLTNPQIPTLPSNHMQTVTNTIRVSFLAIVGMIALFAFISYMRDTIRSSADIDKKLDCANLGAIGYEIKNKTFRAKMRHSKDSLLITRNATSFRYIEMLQKVCRKVRYKMDQGQIKTLLITSCLENEGKSTVAANIALALAESGKKVLLMDLDLRKPSQYRIFDMGKEERTALGAALMGRNIEDNLIEELMDSKLYAVLNTKQYAQSTEMLTSGRLDMILDYLKQNFDYILMDTPPMNVSTDAEAIAASADASLIIIKEHFANVRDINDVTAILNDTKAKPIGCILNQAHSALGANLGGYGYGATYGYGYGYGKYYGAYGKYYEKSSKKRKSSRKDRSK